MKVSVIVCTHNSKMEPHLLECIESLQNQVYPTDIICIVDGDKEYYNSLRGKLNSSVKLCLNEENKGLSYSRNRGVKESEQEIIAFIDDDAVADKYWTQELAKEYWDGSISVGGKILPLWSDKKPVWFPEEFYWMIGATHKGFSESKGEVRNTFGSNLSFKKDIFISLGGFREDYGMRAKGQLQGAETELCDRMGNKYGQGVMYNPNAVIYHKVFDNRLKLFFLLKRAYWQGYSKAIMGKESKLKEERKFLREIVFAPIRLLMLYLFTLMVVIGYVRSKLFN